MDFLDPRKERLNRIALLVGYGLVALAISIASILLLYQTNGYCVDGSGAVGRCGLVFVASQPDRATVRVDGKPKKTQTNTKFTFQSGTYRLHISEAGYRDWQHEVTVLGGDVQRFDYPLLFPAILKTTPLEQFKNSVAYATQSPDRRWVMLAEAPTAAVQFRLYDLKNPPKPVATTVTLPAGLVTAGDGAQSWKVVEWSNDNRHVLISHTYVSGGAPGQEYLLLNRQSPGSSHNLTRDLSLSAVEQLSLFNKTATDFYVYNTDTKTVRTLGLDTPPNFLQLAHVSAFKSYSDDTVLYVTDTPPSGRQLPGTVSVVLLQGNQSRVLRQLPAGAPQYVLDMAQFAGDWYVAVGASNDRGVYVYRNPLDEKLARPDAHPAALRFLRVRQPQSVAFSTNARFIAAQNGQDVGVFDADTTQVYAYRLTNELDKPQMQTPWMDGHRLAYVTGGKAHVVEYDNANPQTLQAALPHFPLFFSTDYQYVFNLQSNGPATALVSTPLRTVP